MKNFICLLIVGLVLITQSLNAQWIQSSKSIDIYFSFAAIPNHVGGTNLFAGSGYHGVYLSTDNGTNWTLIHQDAAIGQVRALAVSDTNLYAAEFSVYHSSNSGISLTSTTLKNIDAAAIAINDTNVFVGTYNLGIYRSSIKGKSWTAVNSGLTDSALYITGLFASGKNLFAGTWGRGAFRSTNNGESWSEVNNGMVNHVHCFADSPNGTSGTNLFAGTFFGEGVYLSTDNGNSWTAMSNGLTNKNIRCLAVSPNGADGVYLFAGTWKGGVFLSTDNGAHWIEFNTGLSNKSVVNGLFVSGSYLFAGTDDGIWRRPLSDAFPTSAEQINADNTSGGFRLEQNYPNPFSSLTSIQFQIPVPSKVTLKVYDILGKEVATLVDEKKSLGMYKVNFEPKGLVSGMYYYRMQVGDFVQTKKLAIK